jgi:hypothetical protein
MSDFNTLIERVLVREGGDKYTNNPKDRGGETKFGISKRANPDLDIASLTKEKAVEVYRERYWNQINADALPPEVRDLAFDTAVHHGVGTAKKWLARSEFDPSKLLAIRSAALEKQAASDPSQMAFINGWRNRLKEFGAPEAPKLTPVAAAALKATVTPKGTPAQVAINPAMQPAMTQADVGKAAPSLTAKREADAFNQRVAVETQPGLAAQFGAAVAGNTDQRIVRLLRGQGGEFDDQADPAFTVPETALNGVTRNDLEDRMKARSQAELDDIIRRQDDELMRTDTLMKSGTAAGIALSFGGEMLAVTNWIAPWTASRTLGYQALKLAAAGRAGATVGRTIGESVVSGTAIELALQTGEGRYDPANLLLAATADVAIGGAMAYQILKTTDLQRATIQTLEREVAMVEQAQKNIGEGATPEQINAEYAKLRTEELKAPLTANVSPIPASRKLMESPDELDAADAAPELQADLRVSTPFADEGNAAQAGERSLVGDSWDQAGRLGIDTPPELLRAADRRVWLNEQNAVPGVQLHGSLKDNADFKKLADTMEQLRVQFLPDVKLHLTDGGTQLTSDLGAHRIFGPKGSIIAVRSGANVETMVHEFGHAVFAHRLARATPEAQAAMEQAWKFWQDLNKTAGRMANQNAALSRSPVSTAVRLPDTFLAGAQKGRFSESLDDLWQQAFPGDRAKAQKFGEYFANFDEFSAEQFAKFVESEAAGLGPGKLTVPQQVFQAVARVIREAAEFFGFVKKQGLVKADASFEQFFVDLLNGNMEKGLPALNTDLQAMALPTVAPNAPKTAADSASEFLSDPIAAKYGLTNMPVATAAERAQAKAMLNLYKKADAWDAANPKDAAWDKRAQNLIDNSVFSAASTGLTLLKSNNPVARMIASELLEDASGAGGKRQSTAAISKYLHERLFMGNTVNDVQNAYELWRKAAGGTIKDDFIGGEYRARFDRAVAEEIENRRVSGSVLSKDANVNKAADSLEAAYDRIRKAQISNKTLGWAGLPGNSKGYMPHKMSPGKWRATTNAQRQVIQQSLVDQFVNIEGWDLSFSDKLAAEYLQRVHARANGGHDSPIGGASAGSAEIVEDALLAMGMSRDEVLSNMKRFNRGAAGWTKGRLDLDLNKSYTVDGKEFKLMDVFETDQLALLRSQAGRASGEVALARHGVYGRPGMQTIRDAMTYGADGGRATDADLGAFDQVAAEFINAPFGDAGPKWMENARTLNSVVRLGGIVFNQFGEFINAISHVGVARTMSGVASMGRMRSEIKALARGEAVDNPLIGSIEKLGGAEFGTDAYKIIMPFDSPDHAYPTYGRDTVSNFDRLLRGASYAQGKLSLWRTVHSVQQRAMAEQIVAKIARYVRDGKDDIALEQFGINAELRASLKADLGKVATWDGDSLAKFDVTQMTDLAQQEALIQAVHRGVSQIIQGTFIGETGKWAHDGYLKMLTQFRTFSLTSMEKQWGRQRNSRGVAPALGILLGSMMAAAPVYMARVYATSIGREDQAEYIEEKLQWELIARQTLNYVAMSGLIGDFLDAGAALAPEELGLNMTGGRAGTDTEFVGNMVAPALSLVDDSWKAIQNLDDPEKLARILPGSRLPFVLPAVNALGD